MIAMQTISMFFLCPSMCKQRVSICFYTCIPIKLSSREVFVRDDLNIINHLNQTGREHKGCMITDFVAPKSSFKHLQPYVSSLL
jgi:hypothetical protein